MLNTSHPPTTSLIWKVFQGTNLHLYTSTPGVLHKCIACLSQLQVTVQIIYYSLGRTKVCKLFTLNKITADSNVFQWQLHSWSLVSSMLSWAGGKRMELQLSGWVFLRICVLHMNIICHWWRWKKKVGKLWLHWWNVLNFFLFNVTWYSYANIFLRATPSELVSETPEWVKFYPFLCCPRKATKEENVRGMHF